MLSKRKISNNKKRVIKFFVILIVLLIIFLIFYEVFSRRLLKNSVDNELEILAQTAMDDAVISVIEVTNVESEDFISATYSEANGVTALTTDSNKINLLKSKFSSSITDKIKENKDVTVKVPLGAFSGLVALSAIGPEIPLKLSMNGSCTTTIKSEFTSAGINQTVHHIYLYVEADVSLTCPIITYETTIISTYELCQTVLVGDTPNLFVGSKG